MISRSFCLPLTVSYTVTVLWSYPCRQNFQSSKFHQVNLVNLIIHIRQHTHIYISKWTHGSFLSELHEYLFAICFNTKYWTLWTLWTCSLESMTVLWFCSDSLYWFARFSSESQRQGQRKNLCRKQPCSCCIWEHWSPLLCCDEPRACLHCYQHNPRDFGVFFTTSCLYWRCHRMDVCCGTARI